MARSQFVNSGRVWYVVKSRANDSQVLGGHISALDDGVLYIHTGG